MSKAAEREERCETCRFFDAGHCHRFPPAPTFPKVRASDWCGEWQLVAPDLSHWRQRPCDLAITSNRLRTVLRKARIQTMGELYDVHPDRARKIPGVSLKSLQLIADTFKQLGAPDWLEHHKASKLIYQLRQAAELEAGD